MIEDSIKICKCYFYSLWFVSGGRVLELERERLLDDAVVHLQQDHGGGWPLKPEPACRAAAAAAASPKSLVPAQPPALAGHFPPFCFVSKFVCIISFWNPHIRYVIQYFSFSDLLHLV